MLSLSNHREKNEYDYKLEEADLDLTEDEISKIKNHVIIKSADTVEFGVKAGYNSKKIIVQKIEYYKTALDPSCIPYYEKNPWFTPWIKTGYIVEKNESGLSLIKPGGCSSDNTVYGV